MLGHTAGFVHIFNFTDEGWWTGGGGEGRGEGKSAKWLEPNWLRSLGTRKLQFTTRAPRH